MNMSVLEDKIAQRVRNFMNYKIQDAANCRATIKTDPESSLRSLSDYLRQLSKDLEVIILDTVP